MENSNLSISQKYQILLKGLPITSEYSAFRAEDFAHMGKLTKPDQLTNLIDKKFLNLISESAITAYISVREEYSSLSTVDRLKFIAEGSQSFSSKKISSDNLDVLPVSLLSDYLKINYSSENRFKKTFFWDLRVAFDDDIISDLKQSYSSFDLLPSKLQSNLTPRAVIGHAQNGHGVFGTSRKAPNTTLDDILSDKVLQNYLNRRGRPFYESKQDFLDETQDYIDSFARLIDVATNPKTTSSKLDLKGKPMFGFNFLKGVPFDSYAFLKGIMFGGYFDNYSSVRKGVKDRYGTDMGGGRTWLINQPLLKSLGINLNELTSAKYSDEVLNGLSYEKRMDLFSEIGLIKDDSIIDFENANSWDDILAQSKPVPKGYFQEYIREVPGPGGSDDLLCMAAAFIDFKPKDPRRDPLWYLWLQMGARGADFVDTLTKASKYYLPGGQDEILSKYANSQWLKKLRTNKYYASEIGVNLRKLERDLERDGSEEFALVSLDEIIDITASGINPSHSKFPSAGDSAIHSSARYFVKKQNSFNDYTNFNNLNHSKGVTNAMDQQLFTTFKYLKKAGASVSYVGKEFIYPLDNSIMIGFQQHPIAKVVEYFSKNLYPTLSNPKTRKTLLKKFFKSY